ncbi:MAG: hypothetical protein GWP09_03170 [Nitrospiraceae bacterium]|nr:hypothetical protein [Nitrospiraceae bacterium]
MKFMFNTNKKLILLSLIIVAFSLLVTYSSVSACTPGTTMQCSYGCNYLKCFSATDCGPGSDTYVGHQVCGDDGKWSSCLDNTTNEPMDCSVLAPDECQTNSDCANVCTPGDTRSCGSCGVQTCQDDKSWGDCVEDSSKCLGTDTSCECKLFDGKYQCDSCDTANNYHCQEGSCVQSQICTPNSTSTCDVIVTHTKSDGSEEKDTCPGTKTCNNDGTAWGDCQKNDPDCGVWKYRCGIDPVSGEGAACVRDDENGTYVEDPLCNGMTYCKAYRCDGNACVQDNTHGIYASSDCNSECTGAQCSDSDGGDKPEIAGTCTDSCSTNTDKCSSVTNTQLMEYYCDSSTQSCASKYYECPNGECCTDGACNGVAGTCTDSDEGKDTSTVGTCTDSCDAPMTDSCYSDNTVKEYYCDSDNHCAEDIEPCPSGKVCQDGKCVSGSSCELPPIRIRQFSVTPDKTYGPSSSVTLNWFVSSVLNDGESCEITSYLLLQQKIPPYKLGTTIEIVRKQ